LRIEVEDIYFLIGLSRRGEVVNLKSWGAGSGMKIEEYIDAHCVGGTPKVRSLLVVEPNYLPDLEVFYFQPCLYPMKYLHPRSMYTLPRGGVQRGSSPSAGSEGAIPPAGGSRGKWAPSGGSGAASPEAKIAL
jgi:hypothetical protein